MVQLVNQYTIVVQEYFERRVRVFLETVRKKILKIEYYWVCFKFVSSQGQIHAHLFAILTKSMIQQTYFNNKNNPKNKQKI